LAYESYNAYLRVAKSTPADFYKEGFDEWVNREFENATTVKTVKHNGTDVVVRVVGKFNTETLSRQNDNYQKIIFKNRDYVVSIGDEFEFNNSKWICTDVTYTPLTKSCTVTKCNNTLELYKNHILYKIPCIVEDKSKIDNAITKYLLILDDEIIVRVPNNATTQLININDKFKIGRWNYIVQNINDIIQPGLLVIKMKWNAEEPQAPNYVLQILNGDIVNINTLQTIQLQVQVLDNGMPISSTPSIIYVSSDETIATVDMNGLITPLQNGVVTITAKLAIDTTIQDSITVNIDVPQNNYSYTLIGNISPDNEIRINSVKTYEAKRYINGVVDNSGKFDFVIITNNVPNDAYTLTIISDTQCSIRCNKYTYDITLRAIDRDDNSRYIDKQIKLRSVI